jgi:multicomponent Na+:H+ antiporter subunit C
MSANLTLAVVAGVVIACGLYLITERSLSRILVGVVLASNGVNVLFLVASGPAGGAPIIGLTPAAQMSDPLPQAMVLTAIVITLGMAAFGMTMAYRSFQVNGDDEVADDVEDARLAARAKADQVSASFEELGFSDTGEDVVSE